jgi:hypothetical protein
VNQSKAMSTDKPAQSRLPAHTPVVAGPDRRETSQRAAASSVARRMDMAGGPADPDSLPLWFEAHGGGSVHRAVMSKILQRSMGNARFGRVPEVGGRPQQGPKQASAPLAAGDTLSAARGGPRVQRACANCEEEKSVARVALAGAPESVQPKLTVGAQDDTYEQEADRVAASVMRMPEPETVQRACPECEQEKRGHGGQMLEIQRQEATGHTPEIGPDTEKEIHHMRGGGQPLAPSVRRFMEPRFGEDFSGVRIHTGPEAVRTSQALNARAYTVGRDIMFGAGQYTPETTEGNTLLSHELTHVVQQSAAATGQSQEANTGNRGLSVEKMRMWSDPILHVAPTIQRATRQELLTAYDEARSRSDWSEMAVRLNGFNDADIKRLISGYSETALIALKDAALTAMPGWNARVVRPINARLAALMGSSSVLYATAKEIQDYLLHSPFLKTYVSSKFAAGNPLEGHIHVDDDATFRTAIIAYTVGKGKTREEAEALEPQQGAFRDGDDIHVRQSDGKFTTTIHEAMHRFASVDYQRRLSSNANEGAAEYFTRIICRDQGLTRAGTYENAFRSTELLVGATSKATVADAYFDGALTSLTNAVDEKKGAGTLARWAAFMNVGSYSRANALLV